MKKEPFSDKTLQSQHTALQQYFPMLRTRTELLEIIHQNPKLQAEFLSWEVSQQQEFLDFCTGVRGIKTSYDPFFKEIFNPEYDPEPLENLISSIIGKEIKILEILPNDNTRIADENSLLVTDIVVELKDGSIVNVEIQKIGYKFPGQRCACYNSDLLLRQYKRVRARATAQTFHYRCVQNVYLIVLLESSPQEFKAFPDDYVHHSKQVFDTGLELEMLQEYFLIPLDIFKKKQQNKSINSKLDAWLYFLSSDEPDVILRIMETYPEFKVMYERIYDMCLNVEKVMDMFSKELQILDRNTVKLMIDELQEDLDLQKALVNEQTITIQEKDIQLEQQKISILEKDSQLQQMQAEIQRLRALLPQE